MENIALPACARSVPRRTDPPVQTTASSQPEGESRKGVSKLIGVRLRGCITSFGLVNFRSDGWIVVAACNCKDQEHQHV